MAATVSTRWEVFVRRGFHPITVVDVSFPGEGIVFENLLVSGGSIKFDRTNKVRAAGTLIISDPALFPALNDNSPISPYGAELHIKTGIQYPEAAGSQLPIEELIDRGWIELVPMGIFTIVTGEGSVKGGNVTKLDFFDRAWLIDQQEHVIPKDYSGAQIFTVLDEIITDADPYIAGMMTWDVIIDTTNLENITLPRGTVFDTGRWDFVHQLAESIGADVFFYRDGNAYVIPTPGITPESEPFTEEDVDWVVDAGPNGILIDVSRSVSRPEANGVVVTGSADQDRPQPFAFITDSDPLSRTFYGGPLGKVVKRFDDSNLTTNLQCEASAKALLRDLTGLQRAVSFNTYGNSAMDPGDLVLLRTLDDPDEIHLLDGYGFDFKSTKIDATTRSIQFIDE